MMWHEGDEGDQCPICLEDMPVVSFRGTERKRASCCGQHICPGCHIQMEKVMEDRFSILRAAAEDHDMASLGRATKQLEQASACPLCRSRVPTTHEEAFEALMKHAEKGVAWAQYNVACMYTDGKGVEEDQVQAARWSKLAAEQGHSPAMRDYARRLHDGLGVEKSLSDAILWLKKSADTGYPCAQWNLGRLYMDGEDVEKNPKEAFRLFQLSADQGYDRAQYNLGMCYCNGEGVPRDLEKALKWSTMAAEQGDVFAMNLVGTILMAIAHEKHGNIDITGKCPIPRALKWFRKAAAAGHADASQYAKDLEEVLSSRCQCCDKKRPEGGKLLRCTTCKAMHYCSKDCQRKHWRAGHKKDCCVQE